ncbi:MAG: capsule assembly Wzi family protein [Candidatus Zixiibacteriota bacterium]
MKTPRLRLLLTILLVLGAGRIRAGGSPWEDVPLDSWIYDAVFELSSQGEFRSLLLHTRPYTRGEIAAAVADMTTTASLSQGARCLWARLRQEFAEELATGASGGNQQPGDRVRLAVGPGMRLDQFCHGYAKNRVGLDLAGSYSASDHLTARTRVRIDSDGRHDTQFHGEYWKEKFTAWVDQAVITGRFGRLRAAFGREFWRWGPSPIDAMLISDHSPSFDGLRLTYRGRRWAFSFHATRLESMGTDPTDPDEPAGVADRYLVGHRLDWRPRHNLEFAFSEVLVFGGVDRRWPFYYMNPLLPYYWEQLNNDVNDNPLWSVEGSWRPYPGLALYGEWLIDDFQIDFVSEPQQIGVTGGIAWTPNAADRRLFLNVEYQRINTFVYGQGRSWNRFMHGRDYTGKAIGIGSDLGTDADRMTLRPRYHLSATVDLTALAEHIRRGSNRIDTPQEGSVPKHVAFPSGVVERHARVGAGLRVNIRARLVGECQAGYDRVRNAENVPGCTHEGLFVRLQLQGFWWKTFAM